MRKTLHIIKTQVVLALLYGLMLQLHSCLPNDAASVAAPSILKTNFYPSSGAGPVGTLCILKGGGYSTVSSIPNIVKFNGTQATIISSTASTITTTVPAGATSGKITVAVGNVTGTSDFDFSVTSGQPDPYILSFSPSKGYGADLVEVTISGVNFSATPGDNTVMFNGSSASVLTASATSLKVQVPVGATTGKITIDVAGSSATATSDADFTVPTPSITSFTPSASIVQSTVVISGSNFSKNLANNTVKFNGATATVQSVNSDGTSLTVTVPLTATTGTISVTVDGSTGTSKDSFTVNP